MTKDRFPIGRHVEGWCGPASIVHVASMFGIAADQEVLAKEIYEPDWGTSGENMMKGFAMLGLDAIWVPDMKLEELQAIKDISGYEVILNWMDGDRVMEDGHYSILRSVDQEIITLEDTQLEGMLITMRRKDFEKRWFDVQEDGTREERWALIVFKP